MSDHTAESLARAAFERLGIKNWDAFWCGWCEALLSLLPKPDYEGGHKATRPTTLALQNELQALTKREEDERDLRRTVACAIWAEHGGDLGPKHEATADVVIAMVRHARK